MVRGAVKHDAELIAASFGERIELTYGSDQEIEKAHRQFISGWMFDTFGMAAVGFSVGASLAMLYWKNKKSLQEATASIVS